MSEIAELDKLCIICLNTETLTPILQLEYQEIPAQTLLKDSNLIKFENEDISNRSICRKCCKLLYSFHCMRKQFFESQETFQSLLKNSPTNKIIQIPKLQRPDPNECIDCVCTTITASNLPTICRICFHQTDIHPIGDLKIDAKSAIKLYEEFSNQSIQPDEMLCLACLDHLLDISKFRTKFENHDFIVQNLKTDETNLKPAADQTTYPELIEAKPAIFLAEAPLAPAASRPKRGARDASLTYKIKCRHCACVCDTQAEFAQHSLKTRTHTSFRTKVKCDACGRLLKNATDYRAHVDRIHLRVQPFECTTCARRFSFKNNLERHLFTHTAEKPLVCDRCGAKFIQKASLTEHVRRHHEDAARSWACEACGRVFRSARNFKLHQRVHAPGGAAAGELQREFVCETCGMAYLHKSALWTHQLNHGERRKVCTVCDKRFFLKSQLDVHMRNHTGEKPYDCGVCAKMFKTQSELKVHLDTHTQTKRYKCEACGKCFRQSQHLKYHKRTHTGDKPFVCEVCYKRFTCSASLREHMRIHTGEKPFKCEVCLKNFRTSGALRKHTRTHET